MVLNNKLSKKMEIHISNELDDTVWQNFLLHNKFANPFQSKGFNDFINTVPGLKSQLFWITSSNELVALCVVTIQKERGIKGYFSRRAIIYGSPLLSSEVNNKVILEYLLESINTFLKNKVIYGEIRNTHNYSEFKDVFVKMGWHYNSHLNIEIPIINNTMDFILKRMKYNRRREINLSIKEGAIIREPINVNEVQSLYNILKNLYKSRVKSPLPDFGYFNSLYKSQIGKIFIVIHNENIIGGSFCIYHKELSINTLYYCGIRDYHKKIFPTHLAIMGAIEFGIMNNLKYLDLMGAGKPNEEYGVRNYKIEFGGILVEYGRFLFISKPFLYNLGIVGLNLIKKVR